MHKEDENQKCVLKMLESPPDHCVESIKALWKKLTPMGMITFQPNWRKIEQTRKMLELDCIEYAEWQDDNFRFCGTRQKTTKVPHGLVRKMTANRCTVIEQSFQDGKAHGLSRKITKDGIEVELFKADKLVASFTFAFVFN